MKAKRTKSLYILVGLLALGVAIVGIILVVTKFEGEMPSLSLEGTYDIMGASHTLEGRAFDQKSGLRKVWIALLQDGKERVLFDQTFPSRGFLKSGLVESVPFSVDIKADDLGLKDGEALLRTAVWDYSYRGWWAGNQTYAERKVLIDTKPPAIDVLSRAHNVNMGGSGLAVYRISEPSSVSGVQVGEAFFQGQTGLSGDPNLYVAFFVFPYNEKPDAQIWITAKDGAGNVSQAGVPYHVSAKRFKRDRIVLSEGFLRRKMPEFSQFLGSETRDASLVDTFLQVNNGLRKSNHVTLSQACEKSDAVVHWEGPFVRLPGSARMAGFGDHRKYEYNGKVVDEQVHLGIDLASTHQAPVPAANAGRVALAEYVGIYGNAVVLDHGFGLFSMYGHLSSIGVEKDQMVAKGEVIGHTGSTGMAGGDHLHFSMMINQTFVNPLEWWDPSWIKHNVTSKLQQVSRRIDK